MWPRETRVLTLLQSLPCPVDRSEAALLRVTLGDTGRLATSESPAARSTASPASVLQALCRTDEPCAVVVAPSRWQGTLRRSACCSHHLRVTPPLPSMRSRAPCGLARREQDAASDTAQASICTGVAARSIWPSRCRNQWPPAALALHLVARLGHLARGRAAANFMRQSEKTAAFACNSMEPLPATSAGTRSLYSCWTMHSVVRILRQIFGSGRDSPSLEGPPRPGAGQHAGLIPVSASCDSS